MATYSRAGTFGPASITGAPVGGTLRVVDATGSDAVLWADPSKNVIVAPYVRSTDAGLVTFHADPGTYTVKWTGGQTNVTVTGGTLDTSAPALAQVVAVPDPTGVAATDIANIQAAIAALPSTGGVVQLQAGTYVIPAPATASLGGVNMSVNNSVLAGQGIGVTTIKVADGTSANITGIIRTPTAVQNSKITFRDFSVDGNKANVSGTPIIIGAYCGVSPMSTQTDTDIAFLRVEISNCTDYGFDPHERVTRLRIIDCISHDNDFDGFTLDGIYDFVMDGCVAYSNGRHGFNLVTGTSGGRIANCAAISNGSNGFMCQNGAKKLSFTGCRARDNVGASYVVNGIPQDAPQLDTVAGGRMVFTGCTSQSPGTHGWQLIGSSDNKLVGCESFDASQAATNTSSHFRISNSGGNNSTRNSLTSCTWGSTAGVTPTAKYGVDEQSSSDGPTYVTACSGSGTATGDLNLLNATSLLAAGHNGLNQRHPASTAYAWDLPSRHGFAEWNYPGDLVASSAGVILVSGTIYGMRIDAQAGTQISNINVVCGAAASGLTAGQCFAVIINAAGVELARSADLSGSFGSTGAITIPLVAPFTPAAGTTLAVLLLFVGTTPPQLTRTSSTGTITPNFGQSSTSPRRFFTAGTAQTAVTTPITMSGTTATGSLTLWCALS